MQRVAVGVPEGLPASADPEQRLLLVREGPWSPHRDGDGPGERPVGVLEERVRADAVHGASLYPMAAGLIVESGLADPLERILVRVEPYQIGATPDELRSAVESEAKNTVIQGEDVDHACQA